MKDGESRELLVKVVKQYISHYARGYKSLLHVKKKKKRGFDFRTETNSSWFLFMSTKKVSMREMLALVRIKQGKCKNTRRMFLVSGVQLSFLGSVVQCM